MNQKDLNRPKTQLQKDCFRQFRKWFPDLVNKIEIISSKANHEHFCFSVASENPEFGKIILDIDHLEITVYTDFHHQHFAPYYFNDKDNSVRRQKAILEALTSVKTLISGNEIIEIERKGDYILKVFRFHKDNPDNPYGALVYFLPDDKSKHPDPNIPTERILISWKEVISKEIISTAAKGSNAMTAESKSKKEIKRTNFWDKIHQWWS